jgi:uncharacterized protein
LRQRDVSIDHPHVMLSGLYVYPVKSLRGISMAQAQVENGRLAADRNWVLVDANGQFMHQRDYPHMARLGVELIPNGIRLHADHLPPLEVSYPTRAEPSRAVTYVRLWRRSAPVVSLDQDIDGWFTEALAMPCRLLAFLPDAPAMNVPHYERHSSLQDATPFHLTTEESLADLNQRTEVPIPMDRFRPNLVVRGATPYAEDHWNHVRVGGMRLGHIKPCTRCAITMTDQQTGVRPSKDPLRALSRYRRDGNEVVFGHYLVAETWGPWLSVGDPVTPEP